MAIVAGKALVALHEWTFLIGPAFCAGFGNGLLLGWLMYASGLVPRRMALVGLIGGPLPRRFVDRRAVRGLQANLHDGGHPDNSGVRLGVVAGHLADRQRVQAVPNHLGADRCLRRRQRTPAGDRGDRRSG